MTDFREIPYSKGFLLTRNDYIKVAHYSVQTLPRGWKFWSDEATRELYACSSNGEFVLIRGHWADVADSPSVDLAEGLLTWTSV